jgi:RES domain-containing protein
MKVFRIEREKYLNTTLSGIGASMDDGNRWNSRFTRLVYTAESRALALLEVAVHLDLGEDLPSDRFLVEIDIPDDEKVQEIHLEDLPTNWNEHPPTSSTQAIGDDFVLQGAALLLKVPSCIVPDEFNYLINPHHIAMQRVRVCKTVVMGFDARLNGIGKP